jgi:hypothetical protein
MVAETWKTDEAKRPRLDPNMNYFVDVARVDHLARSVGGFIH